MMLKGYCLGLCLTLWDWFEAINDTLTLKVLESRQQRCFLLGYETNKFWIKKEVTFRRILQKYVLSFWKILSHLWRNPVLLRSHYYLQSVLTLTSQDCWDGWTLLRGLWESPESQGLSGNVTWSRPKRDTPSNRDF